MDQGITIATVFDNRGVDRRLATRWGFAAMVSTPSTTLLFDTGDDAPTLLANMERLALSPADIDTVVISHAHNDHIGGLLGFLRVNNRTNVLLPPTVQASAREAIAATGARYLSVTGPVEIAPGIRTTGPLGEMREQALVIETRDGLVVITGCAHPGIVSVVRRAQAMRPDLGIALVMGGFHLRSAPAHQIDSIVAAFREIGVQRVAPSHCTGDPAIRRFREAYGSSFVEGGVGMVMRFEAPGGD